MRIFEINVSRMFKTRVNKEKKQVSQESQTKEPDESERIRKTRARCEFKELTSGSSNQLASINQQRQLTKTSSEQQERVR